MEKQELLSESKLKDVEIPLIILQKWISTKAEMVKNLQEGEERKEAKLNLLRSMQKEIISRANKRTCTECDFGNSNASGNCPNCGSDLAPLKIEWSDLGGIQATDPKKTLKSERGENQ